MKKILLSVAVLSMGTLAMAQGFYTSFNVGYGFGLPGEAIAGTGTDVTSSATSATYKNLNGTLGGGVNIGLNPGYMFNEHIGAELGLNYLLGSEFTAANVTAPGYTNTVKVKSNQFRVSPAIVLSTGGESLSIYGKAGIVLPVAGSTVRTDETSTGGIDVVEEWESKGALSLGFHGALGLGYNLSEKLSLFGELSHVSLRIKGKSESMTKFTVAGIDFLSSEDTIDKETIFVDEVTSTDNLDDNSALKSLASTSNYNALFINIGVKFNF